MFVNALEVVVVNVGRTAYFVGVPQALMVLLYSLTFPLSRVQSIGETNSALCSKKLGVHRFSDVVFLRWGGVFWMIT